MSMGSAVVATLSCLILDFSLEIVLTVIHCSYTEKLYCYGSRALGEGKHSTTLPLDLSLFWAWVPGLETITDAPQLSSPHLRWDRRGPRETEWGVLSLCGAISKCSRLSTERLEVWAQLGTTALGIFLVPSLRVCSGSDGKVSAHNEGDLGLIPELGRSPGEGNGNPVQYSCLKNPMDRGAWWATVHGVAKSQTWLRTNMFTFSPIVEARKG